jgi:DNA polymerase-3 subunit gamma/tau
LIGNRRETMAYQVLARKYRPQTFDDVAGQRLITDTLKNAILHDRVAHGYIFSGARGVGKTTTARILAKSLNCAHGPTVTPCGDCDSCREIAAGNSVDVLEIDAASNRGIDEIRELRETVRYLPARDRYKVFIIDEAHMLTPEAFNALLKTLEEPPPRSLFILATTEAHKLPTTIQSRCQHFAFRLLDYREIYQRLQEVCQAERVAADEGSLAAIAQAAEGSVRDALSLLDQMIAACGGSLAEHRVRQLLGVVPAGLLQQVVEAIQAGDAARVLEQVNRLATEGYELGHFCAEFTRYVRNLMVARSCGADSPLLQVPEEERRGLAALAPQLSEEDLARYLNVLLRTQNELRYSLQPRFHLELGLMKLVHARRLASLEGLLSRLEELAPRGEDSVRVQPPVVKRREPPRPPNATPQTPNPESQLPNCARPASNPQPSSPHREAPRPNPEPQPEDPRLVAIKSLLFSQSKFLSSCLNPVARCEFGEDSVTFFYRPSDSWAAELLRSREQQDKLRAACEKVLGHPVTICVTLEADAARQVPRPSARERASSDLKLDAYRKKLNCVWVDVRDLSQG